MVVATITLPTRPMIGSQQEVVVCRRRRRHHRCHTCPSCHHHHHHRHIMAPPREPVIRVIISSHHHHHPLHNPTALMVSQCRWSPASRTSINNRASICPHHHHHHSNLQDSMIRTSNNTNSQTVPHHNSSSINSHHLLSTSRGPMESPCQTQTASPITNRTPFTTVPQWKVSHRRRHLPTNERRATLCWESSS